MHFDSALNCAWLLLGSIALASTFRAVQRGRSTRSFAGWLQVVGVASVVLALFPYISASDDMLRMASAIPQDKQSDSSPRAPSDLIRLYEAADAPVVGQICTLSVTFVFICLVAQPVKDAIRRSIPLQSGRSPPDLSSAV